MGVAKDLPPNCGGALLFAAQNSEALTPSQAEVEVYFDRWTSAIEAEPILDQGAPQRYRGVPSLILTTNPKIISTLDAIVQNNASRVITSTGDEEFDSIMSELLLPEVMYSGTVDNERAFALSTAAPHNQELLHDRLLTASARLPDASVARQPDGHWSWDVQSSEGLEGATATIDYTFGWGDCFVSCDGLHDLRAIVPPTGIATVYDMGGDPLPAFISLAPTTLPLP